MDRRQWLKRFTMTAGAAGLPLLAFSANDSAARAAPRRDANPRKLPPLKITDIQPILTAPAGIRLVIVKVLTDQPGLYGLGCATFTQRARVVETAIDRYLKPFLVGKDPTQIEDVWQSSWIRSSPR